MKKKVLRWIVGVLLTPLVLFVVLSTLLYVPAIQDYAVRKTTGLLSEATNMQIQIGKLRLAFLFDLSLRDVRILNESDEELVDVDELAVDLNFSSLLRGEIKVDGFDIYDADVDTRNLITGVIIKGHLGRFHLRSHGVMLPQEMAVVNAAVLDGTDVEIILQDTATVDTTASAPPTWRLALEKVAISNTRLKLRMPGDTMVIGMGLKEALLNGAYIDLEKSLYKARSFELAADSIRYDLTYEPATEGLDFNHLFLRDAELAADTLRFEQGRLALSLALRTMRMKEKSGLSLVRAEGKVEMDSLHLNVPSLELATTDSYLRLQARMAFAAFARHPQGELSARLWGEIGKQDVMLLAGQLPSAFVRKYPNAPIIVRLSADGNMDAFRLTALDVGLANTFSFRAEGDLTHVGDSLRRGAVIDWRMRTRNLDFIKGLAEESLASLAFPALSAEGRLKLADRRYTADLRLREGTGRVRLKASYDEPRTAYDMDLSVDSLNLNHFLPKDSLYKLSMAAKIKGRGLDFYSPRTALQADIRLDDFRYAKWQLGGIAFNAGLRQGKGSLEFWSDNPLLAMQMTLETSLRRKMILYALDTDIRKVNLQALGVSENQFDASLGLKAEGYTNLKNNHRLTASVTDIGLAVRDTTFHPKNLMMDVLAEPDSTYAYVSAGDFHLDLSGSGSYERILGKLQKVSEATRAQLKRRRLNQDSLRMMLPDLVLNVSSGKDNPICNYLTTMGYTYERLMLTMQTDHHVGVNGNGYVYSLQTGSITLDTLQMNMFQDSTGVKMEGRVRNGPNNKQFVFDARMRADLEATGGGVSLLYLDDKGRRGVDFGIRADVEENGLRLSFSQTNPIIAYRQFKINEDNYVFWGQDRRVSADVDLVADDGTRAQVFTMDNPDVLQDVTVGLSHWNLTELTNVIPYAPHIDGMLKGDVHLVQTAENLSVMSDITVDSMAYENVALGNIALSTVYLPNEDGTHFVDARVGRNEAEIMTLNGTYYTSPEDRIEADVDLHDFPLVMVNGFLPPDLVSLTGALDGRVRVDGVTANPQIGGWIAFDQATLASSAYSLNLKLPADTIRLQQNRVRMDHLKVYSTGRDPLELNGIIDFTDMANMNLSLSLKATNFELINAKRTQQATAYGKVYVDVDTRLQGDMSRMDVTGRLGVLGNTDVTYVLKDSPLTVDDRLSDLVTFVDFADTLETEPVVRPKPMRINATIGISIDQAAQVHCLLSADRSSYIDLEGGGELTMLYSPLGGLNMSGRYTVLSGEMKYSLPVIPLKTFNIKSGSFVEFNGDVLNPTLSLAAVERVKASVTENDVPRTVSFDVGLSITRTLKNMGLEFTLEAPEDMDVQNELAGMSVEQRGRLAVTMLATGMYLADSNTSGFSTQNALNSFLQSEISNIAGNALKTIDLSVGMDNETSADGSTRTDYSFKFAKRFWNNRVSVIVGGKVSTGEDVENTGQTLIDNISLEYRLDKSATRYVTLFYDKGYESLLEGEITEMGAGLVLRRKTNRLGELFIFNRKKNKKDKSEQEEKPDDNE